MIRGSTPTHTFTLPFDPPNGSSYRIVYAQGEDYKERTLFEITTERCKIEGRVVSVKLTAEETLLFDCTPVYWEGQHSPLPVKIQFGIETANGDVLWGSIIPTTVERCLRKDGRVCDG